MVSLAFVRVSLVFCLFFRHALPFPALPVPLVFTISTDREHTKIKPRSLSGFFTCSNAQVPYAKPLSCLGFIVVKPKRCLGSVGIVYT